MSNKITAKTIMAQANAVREAIEQTIILTSTSH